MLESIDHSFMSKLFVGFFWEKLRSTSKSLHEVLKRIENTRGLIFLGGAYRNYYLGVRINDYDIMIIDKEVPYSLYKEICKVCNDEIIINKNGGIRFSVGQMNFDIWPAKKSIFKAGVVTKSINLRLISDLTVLNINSAVVFVKYGKIKIYMQNFNKFLENYLIDFNQFIYENHTILKSNSKALKVLAKGIYHKEQFSIWRDSYNLKNKIDISNKMKIFFNDVLFELAKIDYLDSVNTYDFLCSGVSELEFYDVLKQEIT